METLNFKVFYVKCKPKHSIPISFISPEHINLEDKNVMLVKELLSKDLYFLYENQLFEIMCSIPKVENNNLYYFNMLLTVNKDFDLNKLYNYNFNLIDIKNINNIDIDDITYEWFEKIFTNRNIFNNCMPFQDEGFNKNYNLYKIDLSEQEYLKKYNINPQNLDSDHYNCVSSIIYYSNFNQNKYVKNCFMLLDMQI